MESVEMFFFSLISNFRSLNEFLWVTVFDGRSICQSILVLAKFSRVNQAMLIKSVSTMKNVENYMKEKVVHFRYIYNVGIVIHSKCRDGA